MAAFDSTTETLRYVRVQDDLHGMGVDASGNVILACNPDATRNTMHFAINGIVGDHAYGRFNLHRDGALKGKIVVVADPQKMGVPAGFNQVDTWFRMSAKMNDAGTLVRTLNAGHATIVVPEGLQVPAGMNAVFYDGTLEGRDAAVATVLEKAQVVQRGIGFRSWTDSNEGDAPQWAQEQAARVYGDQAQYVHIGMHDSSPDGDMDSVGIAGRVASFRQAGEATFVNDQGVSDNYIDVIERVHQQHRARIDTFLVGLSDDEFERTGLFYDALRTKLDAERREAREVSREVNAQLTLRRELFGLLEDSLVTLAPSGEIYLAKADGSEMTKLSPKEVAYKLLDKEIEPNAQVWIQGRTLDWQGVAESPLGPVYFQARGEQMPSPATVVAPPPLPKPSAAEQAQEALLQLRAGVERAEDCQTLARRFAHAVKSTALHCWESGATASVQTLKGLNELGAAVEGMAILDGDMGALRDVQAAMKTNAMLAPAPQWNSIPAMAF